MNDKEKQLQQEIEKADYERVEAYMRMFDRILLYTLAVGSMPKEAIHNVLGLWDLIVKKGIDQEATKRTEFLEDSIQGRIAKYKDEFDGEQLRLYCLKQMEIAKKVVAANLQGTLDDEDDNGIIENSDVN